MVGIEHIDKPQARSKNMRDVGMDVFVRWCIWTANGLVVRHIFISMGGVVVRGIIESIVRGGTPSWR
jgi:hypothetical protein